jgi:hypothetical protein
MNLNLSGRMAIIMSLCAGMLGCATQTLIPSPVPPPLDNNTIAAPLPLAWSASIDALRKLGYVDVTANEIQGVLVTEDKRLEGNTAHNQNSGVARFALARDIYSEGQSRLQIKLLRQKNPRQTGVRIVVELKGKVEKRDDIKYTPFKPEPKKEPDSDDEKQPVGVWEALPSNGVLEDRFLAALMDSLHGGIAFKQNNGLLPDRSSP